MNFTALLDVAIGVALVYLGASLFVTIVNEYAAQLFKLRSKQLTADLKKIIDGQDARDVLKANPAFAPFFADAAAAGAAKAVAGSYVDTKVLAQQLVGGLRGAAAGAAQMNDLVAAIGRMPDSNVKKQLMALSQAAGDKVDTFVDGVSTWVDKSLTMMGEAYKKQTQINSLLIGFAIAAAFNLDTVGLVTRLYQDKEAREAVATVASEVVEKASADSAEACAKLGSEEQAKKPECAGVKLLLDGLQRRNQTLGKLPIGWPIQEVGPLPAPVQAGVGWILTALAVSLGASFWFDALNRLINIRHGMRKPELPEK